MKYRVNKAVVIGSGTMGAAIAAHLANAGVRVTLLDIVPRALTPQEEAAGLTLESPKVRNRIVEGGFQAALKSRPASFFSPAIANMVALGNLDDDFDFDNISEATPQPASSLAPVMSPGAENIGGDNLLDDLDTATLSSSDFIMGDESFEGDTQQEYTPDELFSFIPDDIKATRLPGTKQGVSASSAIIVVVLIIMNLAAVGFVISSFS